MRTRNLIECSRRLSIALSVAIACSTSVAAQEDCAGIDADLDRLACYDRASGRTPVVTQARTEGSWRVRSEKSEFKDTTDWFLSLESDEPLRCNMFGQHERATLIIRCMENTTSAYITTACHLTSGHGGYGNVEYRVDDAPTRTEAFDASTDNKALGLWSGGAAIPFVKRLMDGDELLTRFTPFGESPVSARFDIAGLQSALAPLREACGW